MGMSMTIGSPVLQPDTGERHPLLIAEYRVIKVSVSNAPNFPGMNQSNRLTGAYIWWGGFMRGVGLAHLIYTQGGRLRVGDGGGCMVFTQKELLEVRMALDKHRLTATKPPGFTEVIDGKMSTDGWLAALEWMVFWMDFSLKNHAVSAFELS